MKKMILSTAALLTIFSLAACSNKQDTKKETSNSQSTTKVTSKSANTSKSKDNSTDSEDTSSSSLLTDAEINKAKTVGDFKKLFAKLMESVSITEEAGTSVTGSAKEQYDAMISTLKQGLENQKDIFNEGLESIGSDSTVVPKEDREALIEILKDAREELESTRKEMKDMQKELSKSPVADDSSDDSDSDSEE